MNTIKRGARGADVKTLQMKLNLIADGIFGPLTEEAVKEFQRSKGLTTDGIVGAKTWAALGMIAPKNPRVINRIIVHCAATPEGKAFTIDDVRRWHKAQGWSDVGYHYVIHLDGSVHAGRAESVTGAHTTGQNVNSIGVCYIGGLAADGKTPKDTRTPAQKAALLKLLRELKGRYPGARVYGHRDFAAKACPSFDAKSEFAKL